MDQADTLIEVSPKATASSIWGDDPEDPQKPDLEQLQYEKALLMEVSGDSASTSVTGIWFVKGSSEN